MTSGKIRYAKKLALTSEESEDYSTNLTKSINLFNEICIAESTNTSNKLNAIEVFVECFPEEGSDMLSRWRDTLPFLGGSKKDRHIQLLVSVAMSHTIPSHDRLYTAIWLYNSGYIDYCYECFKSIALDVNVKPYCRVEASKFLFASEDEEFRQNAKEAILHIISDTEVEDRYRYDSIVIFMSRSGISTIMNSDKLRVPYDEQFVYSLQRAFLDEDKNDPKFRILSAQYILQMKTIDEEEKYNIGEQLLSMSKNKEYGENTRADAADVVLRLGVGEQKLEARQNIMQMGYDSATGRNGFERSKTIYDNSQNVHEFQEQVDKFIDKMVAETNIELRPYKEIHEEVANMARERIMSGETKLQIFKALYRVKVDTATFSSHCISLAEIFVHVWARIATYDEETQYTLHNRMLEELAEMGDTCSTGHSGRFVNILSSVDTTLTITWSQQIKANIKGRLGARIRDCEDEELKGQLAMGMMDDADDEDREIYRNFIEKQLDELEMELYEEFVREGYVSEEDFYSYFYEHVEKYKK